MPDSQAETEDASKPLNILCLDGGGVRGLSSLLVLDTLMAALQSTLNLDVPPRPCEIFDLICGTSTGGLIALMLGRLRMTVEDAITCYLELSEQVFGFTVPFPTLKRLQGKAIYDASILERCIKETCLKYGGSEEAPLCDPRDGSCHVFVVAITRTFADGYPKLFRSYKTELSMPDQCAIWEAARATTAATTFFEPMKVGKPPETYIDGGLSGSNNPSKLARQEVHDLFPGRRIGCFLSVGTGVGKVVSVSPGYAGIAKACARLVTNCEVVEDNVRRDFDAETQEGAENPYFRFSVVRGVGGIRLDEWRERESLIGITRTYLRSSEQKSEIKRCTDVLLVRTKAAVDSREGDCSLL